MKNFVSNQLALHKKAERILEEYRDKKNLVEACSSAIAEIAKGNLGYINSKEEFQAAGDKAAGEMMQLHIEYFEVLREINEPIMFKEHQINNARVITNMELATAFYVNQTVMN